MPSIEPQRPVSNPFLESARMVGIFARATFYISLIVSALYVIAYLAIGLPFWFAIGVLAGILDIVPGVGALVGLGVAELACFAAKDHYHWRHGWVLLIWLVVQVVENVVITPRLLGRHMNVSSLAVFGALLVGSLSFGPIGLLAAVPVLAVANVFLRYYLAKRAD